MCPCCIKVLFFLIKFKTGSKFKTVVYHGSHKNWKINIFNLDLIIIILDLNQHIRMISKGSFDNEAWSNGC